VTILQNKKKIVICDIETERLDNPQKIWVIVCRELGKTEKKVFRNVHRDYKRFIDYASTVDLWVGHNFINFDAPVLNRIIGTTLDCSNVLDTLILSRLLHYQTPGGHSLEAWGESLGYPKDLFNDFSKWSQELEDRCKTDVDLNYEVFEVFRPIVEQKSWAQSISTEHEIAWILNDIRSNGFSFDITKAKELHSQISSRVEALLDELQQAFPPRSVLIKEVTPKATKHGTINATDFRWLPSDNRDLSPYSVGAKFSRFEYEVFNPKSTKQVVSRLNDLGWKPVDKTKGHIEAERNRDWERLKYFKEYGWKVTETNLATLPNDAPEAAQKLREYLLLTSRVSTLEEWLNAYNELSGAIHGNILHIGAWTHRMSHNSPNQANIPRIGTAYGEDFRALWRARNDRLLVGTDADGIQLRIFAHYINDPEFSKAVVEGRQEDGTDAHSVNQRALGLNHLTRNHAKTFIYAFLLGVGIDKASAILDTSREGAKVAIDNFLERYPGLTDLKKEVIPRDAARGFFIGLDGRKVICDSEHLMLAGYLQNGEAVIMKQANILWYNKLKQEGVPFWQVNFVHDEWQTETLDDYSLAEYIGQVQSDSIKQTGLDLDLNVALAGSSNIGKNWKETH
jgi:DNA polymerase-1